LAFGTYLGGSGDDKGLAIAVDSSGNVFIAGESSSTNFPGLSSPATAKGGAHYAFVTKLDSTGVQKFTTFIGGNMDDAATGIALQGTNIFLVGNTQHLSGFPTTVTVGPLGGQDAFVAELSSSGTLTATTVFGGGVNDTAEAIAIDSIGNIYVVGETSSTDFPTLNPFQSVNNGATDAFITKLTSVTSATLSFSTYLGGANDDLATGVALDNSNNVYISGITGSSGLENPASSTFGGNEDGFVAEFNSTGSEVYFVYVGGSGADVANAIAVDGASGTAYVTGFTQSSGLQKGSPFQASLKGSQDAFVAQVNTGGTIALFTYLGGSGSLDTGTAIAIDASKNIYVTGCTDSSDFPLMNAITGGTAKQGNTDAFVTKLNSAGSALVFSSYYGGNNNEDVNSNGSPFGGAIAVDSTGANIFVTGITDSTSGLPTKSAAQGTFGGGTADAFAAKITP
jgi:hypothetical protein